MAADRKPDRGGNGGGTRWGRKACRKKCGIVGARKNSNNSAMEMDECAWPSGGTEKARTNAFQCFIQSCGAYCRVGRIGESLFAVAFASARVTRKRFGFQGLAARISHIIISHIICIHIIVSTLAIQHTARWKRFANSHLIRAIAEPVPKRMQKSSRNRCHCCLALFDRPNTITNRINCEFTGLAPP